MQGPSRRELIESAAWLLSWPVKSDDDGQLAAILEEHRRLEESYGPIFKRFDCVEARGAEREVELLHEQLEALDRAKDRAAHIAFNLPAESVRGVAYKLQLWRRETAAVMPSNFEQSYDWFVFSAYQDLLRLVGMRGAAIPSDALAARRMRDFCR